MTTRPFRIYGHRGDPAHEPENTLSSFRSALERGADALETDVRLTRDGEVVVFHDATGARTCGEPAKLIDCGWDTVRRWDLGNGQRPIRLTDLLEAFPDVFVNVDVKDRLPEAAEATVRRIVRCGAVHRLGLGSFHFRTVRAIRRAGWQGQLALSVPEVAVLRLLPGVIGRFLVDGDAVQIPVRHGRFRLDRRWFVRRCHRLGLRVDYWTIDDPAVARELVGIGADGIVTNDPETIRAGLGEDPSPA